MAFRDLSEEEKIELEMPKNIIREAFWAISNIAGGPPYMIDAMLSDETLEKLLKLTQKFKIYPEIDSELLYVICNMITNATSS